MKVMHIITDLKVGGAEVMLLNLCRQTKQAEVTYDVVCLSTSGEIGSRIEDLGIRVRYLGMSPGRFDISKLWTLHKWINQEQPDVIQTWMYHADLMGGIAALFSGRPPVVWGIHHTLEEIRLVRLRTRVVVRMNALLSDILPNMIVCCSQSALESHASIGYLRKKMVVIQNGIDASLFLPDLGARKELLRELNLPESARLVGMFARYHPQKDYANLLKATALLVNRVPDVHLILAGEGIHDKNEALASQVLEAGLQGYVHLLGLRTDVYRLMQAMDLVTLSSAFGEALPMVIAEAMACSTPCVVTNVGDTQKIIGETGRVVPPGDSVALASALGEMLILPGDELLRLGQNARDRIIQYFSIQKSTTRYLELYESVVNSWQAAR